MINLSVDPSTAAAWRADFPFVKERVGTHPLVYLDSAASSQKPRAVIERMATFAASEYANVHRGIHHLSERATAVYEETRCAVASLINARSTDELVFTRGTTEAINLVARSWGPRNVKKGDTILLTEMEHHANLLPWQHLAESVGAKISYVPILPNGAGLDLEVAEREISKCPALFAFVHVPNTLGLENPAAQLAALARKHEVTTLVDAAQSVGHQPLDVREIGSDFVVFSAHKMCGPTGIGALYGRMGILETMPPWQHGGEMVERAFFDRPASFRPPPARFEAGTPPIIEAAGWREAIAFLESVGLAAIHDYTVALGAAASERLRRIPGVQVFGPEVRGSGIVSFVIEGVHPHDLAVFANERGVALRAGHHCAQPLMGRLGIVASSRASFYLYNTFEEVDVLADVVSEAIAFFR